jgi:hypothetical protein
MKSLRSPELRAGRARKDASAERAPIIPAAFDPS